MKRLSFIWILPIFFAGVADCQGITVDELLTLSSIPQKNIDNYLGKKGFIQAGNSMEDDVMAVTFIEKKRGRKKDTAGITRTIEMYKKNDTYCIILNTSSKTEWMAGFDRLKKAAFVSGPVDTGQLASKFFQKKNISVRAYSGTEEDIPFFTFFLQKKELPAPETIRYADDLLQFDSHEFLIGFFGKDNVRQDVYYFSEKELKKCSVLFPNSNHQAVFIWDDENNLCRLSYVLIGNILPTLGAEKYNGTISQNTWSMKNGIYTGMGVKELLRLNGKDFEFFGPRSEFSYMMVPESSGNIDFKKIGLMLSCNDCFGYPVLERTKITATEAIENNLPLHVFYIMISR